MGCDIDVPGFIVSRCVNLFYPKCVKVSYYAEIPSIF